MGRPLRRSRPLGAARVIGLSTLLLLFATGAGETRPPPATGPAPSPARVTGSLDDPLDALYRPALRLGPTGEPTITVRVMAAQRRVTLTARGGGMTVVPRAAPGEVARTVHVPEGTPITVTGQKLDPGEIRRYPIVAEHLTDDAAGLETSVAAWRKRGHAVRVAEVGSIFGLNGRVVDTRRALVLLDGPGHRTWLSKALAAAETVLGRSPPVHERLERRPTGTLVVSTPEQSRLSTGDTLVTLTPDDGATLEVKQVEFGVGYRWHGHEDRRFTGVGHVVVDPEGLSFVNAVPLETLLRGLVPAEIFASAHPEALKAQAVTARGEVLAKIGARHLADPAVLCSAQHCQVYKGLAAVDPRTDAAVAATRGEVMVEADGHLVDAVYSAICGGHTESNEVVWGQTPRASLRGRPDFVPEGEWLRFGGGIGTHDVDDWLASKPPAWCQVSSFASSDRFRWTRRLTAEEMNRHTSALGIGPIRKVEVLGRGVSGRVTAVKVVGTKGKRTIHRELPVRRLFGNLNSGMFTVKTETGADGTPTAFVFRGGGWGHGVGMCQVGAIGMAEHGHDYRAILRHYYNGATVHSIYPPPGEGETP